jgi:cell division protein FtsQ
MGGWSNERPVSLKSGAECAAALRRAGYEVTEIDVERDIAEVLRELKPDVAFNALHGPFGESGMIQGLLEVLEIPYTHSGVLASALAMNKHQAKVMFKAAGIPVTDHVIVDRATRRPESRHGAALCHQADRRRLELRRLHRQGRPVAPAAGDPARGLERGRGGDGRALHSRPRAHLRGHGRRRARRDRDRHRSRLLQLRGEIRHGGSHHVVPAQVQPKIYDKVQKMALKAHAALGCRGVSRTDFRFNDQAGEDGELVCLEINTQPGMTETSLVPEQARHAGHIRGAGGLDGGGCELQQVGLQAFADAQPIDPRQLPVPTRTIRRRALVTIGHVWVLHRRVVIRVVAALAVMIVAVGIYHVRDAFVAAGGTIADMVQGKFAEAGFGIDAIEVSGQKLTSDADIARMIALAAGGSTLTFDVQKAQARLTWLQAVDVATVRKVYPNRIVVEIVEKEPVARWRIGNATWLVDAQGTPLARDTGVYAELPLVVGDGAADDALIMIRSLGRHEVLKKDLAALSRIGDRRWDLIYYTGLRVQLPEQGVGQALDRLEMYQRDFALLDRDVTLIDMRVHGMVALKPAVREDAESDKKKKP